MSKELEKLESDFIDISYMSHNFLYGVAKYFALASAVFDIAKDGEMGAITVIAIPVAALIDSIQECYGTLYKSKYYNR